MVNIEIRTEQPQDYHEVEYITREAFWGLFDPTSDVHLLIHKLRRSLDFIQELSFVAAKGSEIIGNIMYSHAKIVNKNGAEHPIITLAPLSVLPKYKSEGVGTMLVSHSIEKARNLGYKAIALTGHAGYYPRFGFKPAAEFGITLPDGESFDAFMVLPLYENSLFDISGEYYGSPVFEDLGAEEVSEFDKQFPPKEKAVMISADALLANIAPAAADALREREIVNLADLIRFSGRELRGMSGMDDTSYEKIEEALKENGFFQHS